MLRLLVYEHGEMIQQLELYDGQEYIIGRAPNCAVILATHPGISRQHVRIHQDDGQWLAQVISKFGEITAGGEKVSTLSLQPGTNFTLSPFEFRIESTEAVRTVSQSSGAEVGPYTGGSAAPDMFIADQDEATFVGAVRTQPYVRIAYGSGLSEEAIALTGKIWLAGRDEACDIFLNDSKVSRRQFEIAATSQGFEIKDLGSSNGTSLNGKLLQPHEPTVMKSGDVITVLGILIHFEVRDPQFDNKLQVIPPSLMRETPSFDMAAMMQGPGGVQRVDSKFSWSEAPPEKKKKIIMIATIAGVVLLLAFLFLPGGKGKGPQPRNCGKFCTLSSQQQQFVKDTYLLAKNLHLQQKYELARMQLQKIHEVVPEGYEDSLRLQEQCIQAYEYEMQTKQIEEEQRRAVELERRVLAEIERCRPVAARTSNPDEIQNCLSLALELDPNNARVNELMAQVRNRADSEQARRLQQAEYASKVGRGRGLFNRAEGLKREKKWLEAIEAYRNHIDSSYPDPNGLKARSQQAITQLRQTIDQDVAKYLDTAQRAHDQGSLKTALATLDQALKIDPGNDKASEMSLKILRELTAQLQALYSDSVIDEGLGRIEDAKEKWKKILELDRPRGDYWNRAKNKLRQYGSPL